MFLLLAGLAAFAVAAALRQRWRDRDDYDYNSRNICIGVTGLGLCAVVVSLKVLADDV